MQRLQMGSSKIARHAGLTVRGRARTLLALAFGLATLKLADTGMPDEAMMWTETSSGALTTLTYGPLNPAATPLFVLSCFAGMNIVVLDVHKQVPGAKPGDPIAIEISSSKAQAPVKAEVETNEATGTTFGEASDIDVAPVLQVMRDPGPVTIRMGDATATLSDQGRAQAVAKFVESCKLGD
jgi:hypothetical protein